MWESGVGLWMVWRSGEDESGERSELGSGAVLFLER